MRSFLRPPPPAHSSCHRSPKSFPSFHKLSKALKVFGPRPKTLEIFGSLVGALPFLRFYSGSYAYIYALSSRLRVCHVLTRSSAARQPVASDMPVAKGMLEL